MDNRSLETMLDTLDEMYEKLLEISLKSGEDWVKVHTTDMRAEVKWLKEKLEKELLTPSERP